MPIDDSELRRLVVDLEAVPLKINRAAEAVVKRGVQNIKDELAAEAKGSRHFGQIAETISYDERYTRKGVEYELGPDKDRHTGGGRPGPLANLAYFGGANGGGGSLDFDGPIDREVPRLEQNLARVIGDAL